MKKIAHILSTGEYSGAEKIAIEICDYLKEKYEFIYVCKPGEIENYLKDKNINYIIYNNLKELLCIFKNYKFDLVHAHDYTASIVSAFCSKAKVISHIHNNTPFAKSFNLKSLLYYISSYRIEKILCVSNTIIEEMYFKYRMKNKLELVYNWINLDERRWKENLEKKIDILFVGRFTEQKDPMLFLEIINYLKKDGFNNIQAKMIGRGELKEKILDYIHSNSLHNNVEIVDFSKVPHKYMKKSKVFFVPSKWEGFGLVFLEAIANECAVVATPVGGIKEIFKDNLENITDDKVQMIDKIKLLLNNQSYREKYVYNNKNILNRFDIKTNIKKIEKYY